jgi:hypothetical protein
LLLGTWVVWGRRHRHCLLPRLLLRARLAPQRVQAKLIRQVSAPPVLLLPVLLRGRWQRRCRPRGPQPMLPRPARCPAGHPGTRLPSAARDARAQLLRMLLRLLLWLLLLLAAAVVLPPRATPAIAAHLRRSRCRRWERLERVRVQVPCRQQQKGGAAEGRFRCRRGQLGRGKGRAISEGATSSGRHPATHRRLCRAPHQHPAQLPAATGPAPRPALRNLARRQALRHAPARG